MRAYTFTNYYLSSIQQGIQPAHALVDMFVKYVDESPQKAILYEWASRHKTMICLNGGNSEELRSIFEQLTKIASTLELPFQKFHEDAQSLDGALTSVAIIVPEYIYEGAAELRRTPGHLVSEFIRERNFSETVVELMSLLNSYGLAK